MCAVPDSNNNTPGPARTSLWSIFLTFARIGAFTIGGGYAMIPIIRDEMLRRGWIPEEEFSDILAISQSAPGLLAVNISIFAGHRIRGVRGSIVATIGTILPSFAAILLIAMLFTTFKDNPWVVRAFMGIRPVVVALILVPMISMVRKSNHTWWAWALSLASLVLVAVLSVSPVYILLCVMTVAFAIAWFRQGGEADGSRNIYRDPVAKRRGGNRLPRSRKTQ